MYGQNAATTNYKYAIKVYNTSSKNPQQWTSNAIVGNDTILVQHSLQETVFLHPSFAVMWKGKNHISHEVELANFSAQKVDSSTQKQNTSLFFSGKKENLLFIALRYELMYRIGKDNARFSPIISVGIKPYMHYDNVNPYSSLLYPTRVWGVGAKFNVTPRLNVKLTEKWFLDFNVPINLFDQKIQGYTIKDPSASLNQQRNTHFNFAPFSGIADISARVGVGFRL